ncbi:MAG: carbon-nitrogen hydrolase family protein [Acidobacteria bacterium]|nr:MAG: carbon-nitrogen hydrolase family protein [Acidobacteriota bacterium]REK02931.1 MAG: carbon-nitrogen hydrolase family protein [Acidobacteriota bacterium]REK13265.1 MAG: carbon-nitrogen hydrolase family protein [Acidobacteriota bacterium]REK41259.1 MAG: carbon-nitrogen hydrolase family protein [Acidobacteriota bacterium]
MDNSKKVKAALVQQPPVFLNLKESVSKLERLAKECADEGADIVVFPETWLPGYPVWLDDAPEAALWDHPPAKRLFGYLFDNSPTIEGKEFERIVSAAKDNDVYIVIGMHERDGASLYNTTAFISPHGDFKKHRKLTPTYTERLVWGVGDGSTLNVLDTPFGVLGGLICWEHWLPLARAAMHSKHEVIHTAQYPTVHERHQIASRQYAFEGQCFVLASGSVLSKDEALEGFESLDSGDLEVRELLASMRNEKLLRGGSAVIAPDISYVTEPLFDDPSTVYAGLDLSMVNQGRLLLDTDGHYSRPDVFELKVNTRQNRNVTFLERED